MGKKSATRVAKSAQLEPFIFSTRRRSAQLRAKATCDSEELGSGRKGLPQDSIKGHTSRGKSVANL